tara:strand:- start:392 stop:1669 length:1278 start_codon:yes stop_codon:yes gene_type:complete
MANTELHKIVVNKLRRLLGGNPKMTQDLEASLQVAVSLAQNNNNGLNDDLYKAIDQEFNGNGWPTTIEAYYDYLDLYVRLIPNEINNTDYPTAWTSDGTKNGYNQKVYDFLCQFYWLVDQKNPTTGNSMQSYPDFAKWLVEFATAWGSFLDTTDSLTPKTLASFKNDSMYNLPWYEENEGNWTTFNQFFYREFNDAAPVTKISPLRPIADPKNNETIVSPADCTFKDVYPIDNHGKVLDSEGNNIKVRLKHTHAIGNVKDLLDNSKYAEDFYGGTFVHYFLSPFDYHRFHTPVGGEVLEIKKILGQVYLNVIMQEDGQWDAPDNATDGYEFTQARGLVIIDAGPVVGKVAVLPIGMAQVSGVMMYDTLKGKEVVKGQEFGKFRFGGSDIIMLFQKPPTELYLFKNDPSHKPIHFQYGQTSLYWNK